MAKAVIYSKISQPADSPHSTVAEVQGLYGTFSFPERLLQKIWQRRDFDEAALRTNDGATLAITHPGKWNHLGGPDFSGAKLLINGAAVSGEVELHLHAKDWAQHRHAEDKAYDNVILHVVLFPCADPWTPGANGRRIPILGLLPWLHRGLEEYAEEEAMERLAGRPLHHAQEALGVLGHEKMDTLLAGHAGRRWRTKVGFAGERIRRLGWESACHHTAMEILGYRFNRSPMLTVAAARPLADWTRSRVDPEVEYAALDDRWSLQGVRPLNHPKLRLRQYAGWCAAAPDWTERLKTSPDLLALANASLEPDIGAWRRDVGLTALQSRLKKQLCGGAIGGSRFDNLMADGFLPLVAAHTGSNLESAWCGWFAGDVPKALAFVLRNMDAIGGRARPVSQRPIQGLIGWMLAKEAASDAQRTSLGGRGT